MVAVVAVIFAIVAIYFAWAGFFLAHFGMDRLGVSAFDPSVMWELGNEVYEKGTWGLSTREGNFVKGIELGLIWIVEAAVILGLAYFIANWITSEHPYCENCSMWTKTERGARTLHANGLESYWQRVVNGEVTALNEAMVGHEALKKRVRLDLETCPKCKQLNTLTIVRISHKKNSKGKEEVEIRNIVKDLLISPTEAELVRVCGTEESEAEMTDGAPGPNPSDVPSRPGGPNASDGPKKDTIWAPRD
jgi:hypothetical protein